MDISTQPTSHIASILPLAVDCLIDSESSAVCNGVPPNLGEQRHVPLFSDGDGLLCTRSSRGRACNLLSFIEVLSAVCVVAPSFWFPFLGAYMFGFCNFDFERTGVIIYVKKRKEKCIRERVKSYHED